MDYETLSGRELDRRIAERVLGITLDSSQRGSDGVPMLRLRSEEGVVRHVAVPPYSTDAPTARGAGFFLELRHPGTHSETQHHGPLSSDCPVTVTLHTPSGHTYSVHAANEALALCRAILKTLDGEGPGRSSWSMPTSGLLDPVNSFNHRPGRYDHTSAVHTSATWLAHGNDAARVTAAGTLWQWADAIEEALPALTQAILTPREDLVTLAAGTLKTLVRSGRQAQAVLDRAAAHPDPTIADMAKAALTELRPPPQ
jgi:hypothetical protein